VDPFPELTECHVLVDGLVHSYKGLSYPTASGKTCSHALMCGRRLGWLELGDPRIVPSMVTCVACLGHFPKVESQRPWHVEWNVKG
jgi:hypothetical protein